MTIGFTHIPSNIRVPGTYFDIDPSNANSGQQQVRTLILGQVLAGSTYASAGMVNQPQITLGAVDAANNGGYGSMLSLMVAQSRARDSFGEVWVLPLLDDPGAVAATGGFTITGTATAFGTLPLYINATVIPVLVAAGMTPAQMATSAALAVNALAALPVIASTSGTAVLTLTAKNKGAAGNDIDVRFAYLGVLGGESIPAGVSLAISPMSGGTTNPLLPMALLSLADLAFEIIVCPYTDAGSLNAMRTLMSDDNGRWSWQRKLYGHVYSACALSLSAAVTLGNSRNDQHVSILPVNGSPLWPPQVAADFAAAVMTSIRADPALPLQYLLTNIPPPPPALRFVPVDRNSLLFDGMSTYKVVGGVTEIERVVTTYQVNISGVADTSYLDAETMHCLGAVCRDLDSFLSTTFARVKLTADLVKIPAGSNLVNRAVIKATLDTRYRYLCEVLAICQDPDGFAAESRVEIAGLGRVNLQAPIRLMGQLRIMAILVSFSKPT